MGLNLHRECTDMNIIKLGKQEFGETFVNMDNVAVLEFKNKATVDVYFNIATPLPGQGLVHQAYTGDAVAKLYEKLQKTE